MTLKKILKIILKSYDKKEKLFIFGDFEYRYICDAITTVCQNLGVLDSHSFKEKFTSFRKKAPKSFTSHPSWVENPTFCDGWWDKNNMQERIKFLKYVIKHYKDFDNEDNK